MRGHLPLFVLLFLWPVLGQAQFGPEDSAQRWLREQREEAERFNEKRKTERRLKDLEKRVAEAEAKAPAPRSLQLSRIKEQPQQTPPPDYSAIPGAVLLDPALSAPIPTRVPTVPPGDRPAPRPRAETPPGFALRKLSDGSVLVIDNKGQRHRFASEAEAQPYLDKFRVVLVPADQPAGD